MALSIRDGNQSPTTLSTIIVSNAHIPAHTVVSLGTQAITDIATAVSGVELGPNTLNALESITVTLGQVTITGGLTDAQLRASAVTIGGSVTATISGTPSVTFTQASVTFGQATITGSVSVLNLPATQTVTFTTASVTFGTAVITGSTSILNFPATQTVTFSAVTISNFPSTQPVSIASVTVGNTVTIAGTVTANPTGTQTIAGAVTAVLSSPSYVEIAGGIQNYVFDYTSFPVSGTVTANIFGQDGNGNPASLEIGINGGDNVVNAIPIGFNSNTFKAVSDSTPLPIYGSVTLGAGTAQIGSVTASINGTVSVFSTQGTSVTTSNFTSTTPSTTIASASAGREILTVFNEGAGNLHICAGATCTTIGYQVRLSTGDYWECPQSQVQLAHSAVFASAGTARVTQIS